MELIEAIKLRKSVRSFQDKPVPEDVLRELLDAARLAPSASNRQEWRFVVARDPEVRRKLGEAAKNQDFVAQAPVVLACCAETDGHVMSCGLPCFPIDVAIVMDHLTLLAVERGLGTCWIGAFHEQPVKEILGIPDNVRVVELLPLGYPTDSSPKEKKRLPVDAIVHWDRW